jgi:drug/metabolite transporter (DMT)-like permease
LTGVSLLLVLAAAGIHATWNLFAKRASEGGVAFVWLVASVSSALYMPVAVGVLLIARPHIEPTDVLFMAGSGAIHACYFTLLQHAYRVGDLSVVYPLARGTGPMLSTIAAIAFLGERPTPLAIAGAVLICAGVFVVGRASAGSASGGDARAGVLFGVATGVIIATYTLWDRHVVADLLVPPLLLDWASNVARSVLLAPFARRSGSVREVWVKYRRWVLGVAALSPLSYILVLTALQRTAVSYVAPAREVSILIGTLLGVRLLGEGALRLRLIGAAAIVGGLVALAAG